MGLSGYRRSIHDTIEISCKLIPAHALAKFPYVTNTLAYNYDVVNSYFLNISRLRYITIWYCSILRDKEFNKKIALSQHSV